VEAKEIITIGELMEIKIKNAFVKTKLQELYQDGRFTVFHPTVKGVPVWLQTHGSYTLRFYRDNGVFSFDAQLLDWYKKDDIRMCLFEASSEVEKAQRRQSYRLPIVLDALLRPEDAQGEPAATPLKAKTVDISEHGVLLTCFTRLALDTCAAAELKLSPTETMTLRGKVLRCENPADKNDPFRIVLLFAGSTEQERSHLGRYILRQQIDARKKKNQEVMP
jgi:c-di-GMP-binding flagellar brake protein YcgR